MANENASEKDLKAVDGKPINSAIPLQAFADMAEIPEIVKRTKGYNNPYSWQNSKGIDGVITYMQAAQRHLSIAMRVAVNIKTGNKFYKEVDWIDEIGIAHAVMAGWNCCAAYDKSLHIKELQKDVK